MAGRSDTREALLQAGIDLFLMGGYDFTGTNAILERADAPRGSFYHHFEDKKDFALAAAQHYYEHHLPVLDRHLTDDALDPVERLRQYFRALAQRFGEGGWTGGCLLGMLGQELADRDDESRRTLFALFGRWRHRIADCLREAQLRGEIERDADCDEIAGFLLDAWEGALISMKTSRSSAPLERFVRVAFDRILGPLRPSTEGRTERARRR